MEELASSVASAMKCHLVKPRFGKFPDGTPNINVGCDRVEGDLVFMMDMDTQHWFDYLSALFTLARKKSGKGALTVVIPYFSTGTMEREDNIGDVPTALTSARFLTCIANASKGYLDLLTFDIHAPTTQYYFGDEVRPRFVSGLPLMLQRLREMRAREHIAIVYPDEGAWKRFHGQVSAFGFGADDEIVCTKVREGDARRVSLKEGTPVGRHCVIIDDIVQSGRTLIETKKVLEQHGAACVSAYATHGVFPNRSWQKLAGAGFAKFWICDSVPSSAAAVRDVPPFEVIPLAPVIVEQLMSGFAEH